MEGEELLPVELPPPAASLTRCVVPVNQSCTKTSSPAKSFGTRLVIHDSKAMNRPSSEMSSFGRVTQSEPGEKQVGKPCWPFEPTLTRSVKALAR